MTNDKQRERLVKIASDVVVDFFAEEIADRIIEDGWMRPPCKVGDMVYQVTRNFISEFRVRFIEIATCGNLFLHTDLISGIIHTGEIFPESEIGKTVFLTREEAEKALGGAE